jgi:hypothetical protein
MHKMRLPYTIEKFKLELTRICKWHFSVKTKPHYFLVYGLCNRCRGGTGGSRTITVSADRLVKSMPIDLEEKRKTRSRNVLTR